MISAINEDAGLCKQNYQKPCLTQDAVYRSQAVTWWAHGLKWCLRACMHTVLWVHTFDFKSSQMSLSTVIHYRGNLARTWQLLTSCHWYFPWPSACASTSPHRDTPTNTHTNDSLDSVFHLKFESGTSRLCSHNRRYLSLVKNNYSNNVILKQFQKQWKGNETYL